MPNFELYSAAGLNCVEAAIWIAIGFFLYWGSRKTAVRYPRTDIVALGILFVAFGVSDVFEIYSGAWWRPWWLLLWKTLNAIGLLYLVGKLYLTEKAHKRRK